MIRIVFDRTAVIDFVNPCPQDEIQAHGTGLSRRIQITPGEIAAVMNGSSALISTSGPFVFPEQEARSKSIILSTIASIFLIHPSNALLFLLFITSETRILSLCLRWSYFEIT